MCNVDCLIFGVKNLTQKEVEGKKIIEVGSYDLNGSIRSVIEHWNPSKYIGVDIRNGKGVDEICDAENIIKKFGKESFDIVISTELIEHVRDWRKVISNLKNICKPGGLILITTRSYGFYYHVYPNDFWRYELDDMKYIFSDCEILSLEKDTQAPGIFIKVKKPKKFIEKDLSEYKLYNIIGNKRSKEIKDKDSRSFYFLRIIIKEKSGNFLRKLFKFVLR